MTAGKDVGAHNKAVFHGTGNADHKVIPIPQIPYRCVSHFQVVLSQAQCTHHPVAFLLYIFFIHVHSAQVQMKMRFNQAGKQRFSGQVNDIGPGSDFCGFCVFDFLDNAIFQNDIGEIAFKTFRQHREQSCIS